MPTLKELEQLPLNHRETIPYDYIDAYGHMNVRYYFAMWEKAAHNFMRHLGADVHSSLELGYGNWVLRQVVDYKAEVREDESIAIRGRLLGRSPKRLHNMYWMINESKGVVAATSEALITCADLKVRKTAPYPEAMSKSIGEKLAEFDALDWEAPLSGAVHA